MQINNSSYNNKNFKALKIAKTSNFSHNCATNIDLYKILKDDTFFLEKLEQKIKFKELFPKLDSYSLERWENIFRYCVDRAKKNENFSYVAICDNKPCGILTAIKQGNNLYLDGICSIPVEINKKVNNLGKTLFLQFFKDVKAQDCKSASLSAVNNGPFNVVKKYEKLGFIKDPCSYPYSKMVCNKFKIEQQTKQLEKEIRYKECAQEKFDLNEFIN